MAQQYSVSTKLAYNPKKDNIRTLDEKINLVFTEHQMALLKRKDVTKSLILALTKVVDFKQPTEEVVAQWVKKDVEDLLQELPTMIEE